MREDLKCSNSIPESSSEKREEKISVDVSSFTKSRNFHLMQAVNVHQFWNDASKRLKGELNPKIKFILF